MDATLQKRLGMKELESKITSAQEAAAYLQTVT